MSEEADARAKILEATQELFDARLARGQLQSGPTYGSAVRSLRSIRIASTHAYLRSLEPGTDDDRSHRN